MLPRNMNWKLFSFLVGSKTPFPKGALSQDEEDNILKQRNMEGKNFLIS